MKTFTKGKIVSWRYRNSIATGVIFDTNYISVAVNYRMDRNVRKGDLWYFDDIHKQGSLRLATEEEIANLITALDKHKHPYKYNRKLKTIRDYNAFPTLWMRLKEQFLGRIIP